MSSYTQARARVAALSRDRKPDDPEFQAAKLDLEVATRDLRAANAEKSLRDLVDSAPPLTDDQRAKLTALLSDPA